MHDSVITEPVDSELDLASLKPVFLALLPRVEQRARIAFRNLHCSASRDDAIAETVATVWVWFIRLMRRGKNPVRFVLRLATYATCHVRAGRRLCGQERAKDVLSPVAQARHGFVVGSLPDSSSQRGNVYDEALHDNTQTPPDEQAAFRCDFPRWLSSRCERDRRLLDDLMLGERTQDVARRFGLTQARISQMRRDFHDDWVAFCGDVK